MLRRVGQRIRARRVSLGITQKQLASRANLSLRFLAELERGGGNISLRRFAEVAAALGVSPAVLLSDAGPSPPAPLVALVGLRGAGKSTVGACVAERLGVPFIELDVLIERAAGLALAEIFELHGEAYYRGVERETLRHLLDESPRAVVATGGSIVGAPETWALLKDHAITVWLRARPEDHWNRVLRQGDRRPMSQSPRAYAELVSLYARREPAYATAHHTVDTSGLDPEAVCERVIACLR